MGGMRSSPDDVLFGTASKMRETSYVLKNFILSFSMGVCAGFTSEKEVIVMLLHSAFEKLLIKAVISVSIFVLRGVFSFM